MLNSQLSLLFGPCIIHTVTTEILLSLLEKYIIRFWIIEILTF